MYFLLNMGILQSHVSFKGCSPLESSELEILWDVGT